MQSLVNRRQTRGEPALRMRVAVSGAVQGVGFRPFIYRLAMELALKGWVRNSSQGVLIDVEGRLRQLETFLARIKKNPPPRSRIDGLNASYLAPKGYTGFEIAQSQNGLKTAWMLPDMATCADCLNDLFDPSGRRYLYPFTNCTNCGPRFSILENVPYDRRNTTMKRFQMCPECQAEYHDPANRRFHAEPNCCSRCGPQVELRDKEGRLMASRHDAILEASQAIRRGLIVAVKGLGGFHLMVDAVSDEGVQRLRERKRREEKPFALLYPSLPWVKRHCEASPLEESLLSSPEAPIVLLRSRPEAFSGSPPISRRVAPNLPYLGVVLPYTPLHHLLAAALGIPVVATSGNLSEEPICTTESEALDRLAGVADLFLIHNRPIARPVDDSVVRVMVGEATVMRRSRGYAPLPIPIQLRGPVPDILAVGGHTKDTVALALPREAVISQHIGDLATRQGYRVFQDALQGLASFYDLRPKALACDLHPDYLSTQFAEESKLPVIRVQHHHAHVLSCMAENGLEGSVLGIAWDGTGYGTDGTVWGGEFLLAGDGPFQRLAHLRNFPLVGGEKAVREPRRAALGILYEVYGEDLFNMDGLLTLGAFSRHELGPLRTLLKGGLLSPSTSSAGRLFDAVASILGLRQYQSFEGQAAMELESACEGVDTDASYRIPIQTSCSARRDLPRDSRSDSRFPASLIVDWEPMVRSILEDFHRGLANGEVSARFHNTLAEAIVAMARIAGKPHVVLTGGCFQNRYLIERTVQRLRQEKYVPVWHRRVPPNDGGLALGQLMAASAFPGRRN